MADLRDAVLLTCTRHAHHVHHVHHVPLRVWLILGILYYYRALTMFITVLPKPDETYICAPKVFIFSFTKGFWLF